MAYLEPVLAAVTFMNSLGYTITNNTWTVSEHMHWYFHLARIDLKNYRIDGMVGREGWLMHARNCHDEARKCLRHLNVAGSA